MLFAEGCSVTNNHVTITCLTVAGTGLNHTVQVTIDGVASLVNPNVLQDYGAPSIMAYSDVGALNAFTRGMQVH